MGYVKSLLDQELSDLVSETQVLDSLVREIMHGSEGKQRIILDKITGEDLSRLSGEVKRLAESAQTANGLLYENRGRASLKKRLTSAENGKKGGRPPKEITLARRRVRELEDLNFPGESITDSLKQEHDELVNKIRGWEEEKGLVASCWTWN